MNLKTIIRYKENPWRVGRSMARRGWLRLLPDRAYLSLMYRAYLGKKLDWKAPRTFNEKLQWLKLYDRKPVYTKMVDKFEAKQFAADLIGSQYIVPCLGGPWDSFDEIDFDTLPNQFVLKTTHDCGGVWICKDKQTLDRQAVKRFLQTHMKNNYYLSGREWSYKDVKPRIFAEIFLKELEDELHDYKFFCFDGTPKLMFIASERQSTDRETKFDFFDMEFNHLPIINGHPNAPYPIRKPENFELMKELASILSQGVPHLRVDFYECGGQLYLGELTFSHWSGFVPFEPVEWDETLGSWINLPNR